MRASFCVHLRGISFSVLAAAAPFGNSAVSLIINTNISSLNTQRLLSKSSEAFNTAAEKLSTGKKLNAAADDAAGFAIAERMTSQINGLNAAIKNVNDGLSMFAAGESAAQDALTILQRVRELAVQAANDTNSETDRNHLNAEVESLLKEVDRIASSAQYNNQNLLDGSRKGGFQVGSEGGQTVAFEFESIKTQDLGLVYGDPKELKENIARISSVSVSQNDEGEIITRAFFENDWDALRASHYASDSKDLQVDDWNYKVKGTGLDNGQFYLDFDGLIDEGSLIRADYVPQMEIGTHHQNIVSASHSVESSGSISSKIFFDQNDRGNQTRIAHEISKNGSANIAHLNYAVLSHGIEDGNYFVEVDGYVTSDHSLQLENHHEIYGNTFIANSGSVQIVEKPDGRFASKISFGDDFGVSHQRADYFARETGSVIIQGREYKVSEHGMDGDAYHLTVDGLVLDTQVNIQGNFSSDLQRNLNIESVMAAEVENVIQADGSITSKLLFNDRPERAQLYANQGDTVFLSNLDFEVLSSGTDDGTGLFYLEVNGLVTQGYVSGFITSQMRADNDMADYTFSTKAISQFSDDNGDIVSRVTFNSWEASLASSTFMALGAIVLNDTTHSTLGNGMTSGGDYYIDVEGEITPGAQMTVSSLHNPYFWSGAPIFAVSQTSDLQGAVTSELEFSNAFEANLVSQRINSTGSLELNGNSFDVLSEGQRDNGNYFVSVNGFVGAGTWVEYSNPSDLDGLYSLNSLRVSALELAAPPESNFSSTRVYFDDSWAATQASSAVRGKDQFVYGGHLLVLLGEGVNDEGEYYIEVKGSVQQQEGQDFYLNLINRNWVGTAWSGSSVDSVSYASSPNSDNIISTVALDVSGNTTSLSFAVSESGTVVVNGREFSVSAQSVTSSGQLQLQIDGYVGASANIDAPASLSKTLPNENGFNSTNNVSYSMSSTGEILSKIELGANWEAQRADFVGDKYGKILIDGLPFDVISEALEENGSFSISVQGYVQANRGLGSVYDDRQSSNHWFGHVTASHSLDDRGEVISRIRINSQDDYNSRSFAHAASTGTLISNGHKLDVIGFGVDENSEFYADIDGFVANDADMQGVADTQGWRQRNQLGSAEVADHTQSSGSVRSVLTFADTYTIQKVSYFAQKDGALSIDDREYRVVGESLNADGSYRLTLDGFISGNVDLRSNAFSMSSQKVHLDVSDVSHVTQSDGSFQTKVTLQQHINPQDVSQYVSRDGAIVSEGMIYQVLDNGVDESGSAFLVVSGYVASGVSVGALSDLRATEEGFDQTNLQIGHAHQGDIVVSASAETSKIFFQSEHERQLASQFAQRDSKIFIERQQFEIVGDGIESGSYYIEVDGVAESGQIWVSSEPATDVNVWLGHSSSRSSQVESNGSVTSTLSFNSQDAQRVSLSVQAGDRIYQDIRGAGYKILESGVNNGDFYLKLEGYIAENGGFSTKTNNLKQLTEHISNIQEGNSEILVAQDGTVQTKLLITENAQTIARLVRTEEQLFFDESALIVDDLTVENGDVYLTVQGMITSGGIQRAAEPNSTTFIDLRHDASEAILGVSAAIDKISSQIADYGATQSRLMYSVSNLMNVTTQTEAARSRIEDANFATESAALAKAHVLKETGAAMLAQANARPQMVLQLIR